VLGAVSGERVAVLSALHDERLATQEFVSAERVAAIAEIDRLGRGWIDLGFERTNDLVDRLFIRIVILLAVAMLGAAVLALIVVRAWHHRGPEDRRWVPPSPRRPAGVEG
jgi:hypothetical protein